MDMDGEVVILPKISKTKTFKIMANYKQLIPFIFHFSSGVYGKNGSDLRLPLEEQVELAKKRGWSDDPDDPGGATMVDVTISTYSTFRKRKGLSLPTKADLRGISFEEWAEILKTMYWDRWRADEIASQGLANMLVDWTWASGYSSIRKVQRILGVKPDGRAGPVTLAAINNSDPELLFRKVRKARELHYRQCRGAWKYLKGWLRRLDAILPDGTFKI